MVNEPLESISLDLGFNGNTLAEGDHIMDSFFLPYKLIPVLLNVSLTNN